MLNRMDRRAMTAASILISTAIITANAADEPVTVKPKLSTEELVVTARKREETLQEVPLSVSAFSAEKLEQVGAFDNEDVALLTPNFNTNRQVGRRLDRPTIRGQSSPSSGAAPNASYFIDGVFVSGSIQTTTLGPVERVEILRGPQSAQFGRATFSGAVNYVTRRPTNEFSGQFKTSAASHDSATVSGWASGPIISDRLYYFASAAWDTYGGEYRNSLKDFQAPILLAAPFTAPTRGDNSRLGGTDTKDFAAKLLWTINDTSELTFKFSFTKGDDDHYLQVLQETGELNCFLPTDGTDGTADNRNELWYETSPGAYCGKLNPDRVAYAAQNPFNPLDPSFDVNQFPPGWALPPVPGTGIGYTLPGQGDTRQGRFNLPDMIDGINYAEWLADPAFNPSCTNLAGGISSGLDCIAAPSKPGTEREQKRFLLQFEQDFGDWTWLSRAAFNEDEFTQTYDLDRTEARPVLSTGLFHTVENGISKDYTFESRLESPGDSRLRGSIGVNYFHQEIENHQRRFPAFALAQFSTTPLEQEIDNIAVFGTLDFSISDEWSFSAEARWAKEDRDIASPITCTDPANPFWDPLFDGKQATGKISTEQLTPRFTLRYEPSDTTMLYALMAKGDKPAEFNRPYYRNTSNGCQTIMLQQQYEDMQAGLIGPDDLDGNTVILPEKAWTYEAGVKKTWMDRRLITNISGFYIDWENQAVAENQFVGSTISQINVNSGKSEVWGLELETNFVFTENLSGQFSYGLANATFIEYNDISLANVTGVGYELDDMNNPVIGDDGKPIYVSAMNNAKGNQVPGSPKHSFIFGLNYLNEVTLNLLDGPETLDWFVRTEFILETERYSQANNFTKYPNRKLWNGRIGLDSPNWTLTAYVNNILDDLTPTGIFTFPVIDGANYVWSNGVKPTQNSLSPAFGRAYGLEITYRFGD